MVPSFSLGIFLLKVRESAGAQCKPVLQEITALIEEQLQTNGQAVKELFGAAMVLVHSISEHWFSLPYNST